MNWQSAVERTVTGLGYDLVDAEKSAGGLLRVFIDHLPDSAEGAAGQFITVDDCEKVTRQLQYVLEVEACAYERLEVSSPGLDRPLKRPEDFERFAGAQTEITFKQPFQGRKKFAGELQARDGGWRVVLPAPELSKTKAKALAKAQAAPVAAASGGDVVDAEVERVLDFTLDELRDARLVPVLDFKGRRRKAEPSAAPGEGAQSDDGGQEE